MNRLQVLSAYLDGQRHLRNKGHLPVWYDLGIGQRECTECLMGRGGPRGGRSWLPVLVPAGRPL